MNRQEFNKLVQESGQYSKVGHWQTVLAPEDEIRTQHQAREILSMGFHNANVNPH